VAGNYATAPGADGRPGLGSAVLRFEAGRFPIRGRASSTPAPSATPAAEAVRCAGRWSRCWSRDA